MNWLQLDPASTFARTQLQEPPRVPSLWASLWRGIIGFTIVSVAGFAPWAVFGRWFYRRIGEAGLYAVCAIVFIGLSGALLHRLIIGPGSIARFYQLFAVAFSGYSAAWIAGWMTLGGHAGSVAGLLAGCAVMAGVLVVAFAARREYWRVLVALFLPSSLGYFAGGWLEAAVSSMDLFLSDRSSQRTLAKTLWGVSYGVGFGAGLGLAFHICQTGIRRLLQGAYDSASSVSRAPHTS